VTVQIGIIAPTGTVSHGLYPVSQTLKTALVTTLLQQLASDRVLIFTRTKHRARNLATKLAHSGFRTSALQGNMSQNARQGALDGFRRGSYDILVATDIAARGIDVSDITHVINFDMPDTVDAYIHRIGRTGRAQATGKAFTLSTPEDEVMIRDIEKVLGNKIERVRLPDFNYTSRAQESPSQSNSSNALNRQNRPSQPRQPQSNRGRNWSRNRQGRATEVKTV
jgi:ATP-dependent RNA helicase RhlE